jgi:4-amino-4-deoxy-L-arabinose transferase-like glycosyltransferase
VRVTRLDPVEPHGRDRRRRRSSVAPVTAPLSHRSALAATAVFLVALAAFLPWIGAQEIWSKDEARTALVVKEMLDSGDWSLPRVPGGVHSRKPPLYHWMVALLTRRGVDEVMLRVPAAAAAAGTASLTFLIGAQLATPAVGFAAVAMLTASPIFFEWARIARMETLLVFCIALSVWGLSRWITLGGRANGLIIGLGIGLGALAKGPAGLLPLPIAGLTLLAAPSRPAPLRELWPGLALALALPLAWLAPAALAAPDFAQYVQHVGPTMAHELARPSRSMVSAVGGLAFGFFPWTALLPGSLVLLARRRPLPALVVVALAWLIVVLVVFLVTISPRVVYFLPACPALALIAAWGWLAAEGGRRRWLTWPLGLAIAAAVVTAIVTAARPITIWSHGDPLEVPPMLGLVGGGAVLGLGLLALGFERRGRAVTAIVLVAAGVVTTLLALDVTAQTPFYKRLYPIRASARHLERRIPPGAEVGYTEAQRGTALAVYLSRPLRQLPPVEMGEPPTPAPPYVLLPEADFLTVHERWSLRQVDEVSFRNVRYILAATGR